MAGSGSSRKKVIVRKFSREWNSGYVDPQGFAHDGRLELLDSTGKVLAMTLQDVKMMCFVREFPGGDSTDPERLVRRNFTSRPRTPGLWIRMRMRDGDELEGLASNDFHSWSRRESSLRRRICDRTRSYFCAAVGTAVGGDCRCDSSKQPPQAGFERAGTAVRKLRTLPNTAAKHHISHGQ